MDIKAGEYIRTIRGELGIFDRFSSRKETSLYKSPFNCFIKLQGRKTPLQCHRDYIVKHSKNIIDLIEVGDIVNGYRILNIVDLDNSNKKVFTICKSDFKDICKVWGEEDIETILTKEQYNSNCYKL